MKRLGLLWFILLASSALGQTVARNCAGQPCLPIVSSGGTLIIDNYVGGMNVSFEELITGSPASSTITVQGCFRGGTCDSAMDTNSSNAAAAIRSVVPTTKPYSYFLITATWSGGTNVSVQINPVLTSARAGGGSGGGLSGMTAGQVPIAATSSTVTSSKAIQGTDTNLLSSGTISGTGAALCTDTLGGATTTGCPSGSGTVSANNGVAGAVANYASAGGSTTVGPVTGVNATSNELDLGTNGSASGVIGFNGSTSGKATCTAPAVAGTTANSVTCTNNWAVPGVQFVNPQSILPGTNGIFNTIGSNMGWYAAGILNLFTNASYSASTSVPFHFQGGNLHFVTSNFTTAANTSLQTITGLTFTHVTSNAFNWNFHCSLAYSQATGTAAVAFGIQAATNAPTNIFATGKEYTAAGTVTTGVLATLTTTTATAIVSGTPGATATNLPIELDGTLELPASANTINFMVSTATSADAVTVLRGSYCMIF